MRVPSLSAVCRGVPYIPCQVIESPTPSPLILTSTLRLSASRLLPFSLSSAGDTPAVMAAQRHYNPALIAAAHTCLLAAAARDGFLSFVEVGTSSSTRAFKHPERVHCSAVQLIDVIPLSDKTRLPRDQAHQARSGADYSMFSLIV